MSRVRPMRKEDYSDNPPRNKPVHYFKPGESGNPNGKPKGSTNKTTRILKEAVLLAAEQVGEDGQGKDGLVGYLKNAAVKHPKSFLNIVGRLLPLQVVGDPNAPAAFEQYESAEQMRQKLIERGIPLVLLTGTQSTLIPVKRERPDED